MHARALMPRTKCHTLQEVLYEAARKYGFFAGTAKKKEIKD